MNKEIPSNYYSRANLERNSNVLPLSALAGYPTTRTGMTIIDTNNHVEITNSNAIPDSSKIYHNEKQSNTVLYGIKVKGTDLYQKNYFNPNKTIDKLISYSALELGPFNGQRMIATAKKNGDSHIIGPSLPSYNELYNEEEDLKPIRLDLYLNSIKLKPDLESFLDYQNFINNPKVQKDFSPQALDAIVIRGFFGAIKTGQSDKNSRNIILQYSKSQNKIIACVEIDGELNSYFDYFNADNIMMSKGIFKSGKFNRGETYNEFINIIRHHKDYPQIDWGLFLGYHQLSKYFFDTIDPSLTYSTNSIKNLITKGYYLNKGRYPNINSADQFLPSNNCMSIEKYEDFAKYIIEKTKQIDKDIDEALSSVYPKLPKTNEPIFDNGKFKSHLYDSKGRKVKITDKEYSQLGLE